MSIVFWNDHFCPEIYVKIPIRDRGFLFGDGIFTTIRVENGAIESLDRHLKNLEKQCRLLGIVPLIVNKAWIEELIIKNRADQGIWRLKILLTGGNEENLRLASQRTGQLIITLKPYTGSSYSPLYLGLYPYALCSTTAKIKSLAYLERLQIKEHGLNNGFDECLVRDAEGFILETAFANIFWRMGDQIFIPDPKLSYYFGVSLEKVIEAAKKNQLNINFVRANEIPGDAQVYLCNSMIGICPVTMIEKQFFLRDVFFEMTFRTAYKNVD